MLEPTKRFSNRVEDYVKYRPSYPAAILQLLERECRFNANSVIADIGSGTGKLSELFLKNGNLVYGVEPNQEMREAGEALLRGYPNFFSISGTAEATGLVDSSLDLITAGQAFHWFEVEKTQQEFKRILKPGGWVMLVWNHWDETTSDFFADYLEQLIQPFALDYKKVTEKNWGDKDVLRFFKSDTGKLATLANPEVMDFQHLLGRVTSSSYMPAKNHPQYPAMVAAAKTVFDTHQHQGTITFDYETRVYYGQLA
jgi:SAM-dependent methyltransferase